MLPIIINGAETWTLRSQETQALGVCGMRYLRIIRDVAQINHILLQDNDIL